MRILVLTPTFLPAVGGAELVILQVYKRLATRHSVLFLTPHLSEYVLSSYGSCQYDDYLNFGVQHYYDRLSLMRLRGHRITFGLIPPFSLSAVAAIKQATRIFKPDIINVHYVVPTGLAAFYTQNITKIPAVITYNGRDVPGPGVPFFWKYWHRFISQSCADITFVSRYCRDVIYGQTSDHGHIIYNGVDDPVDVSPQQIANLRTKLQFGCDEYFLFSLQRLDYVKRVDVLVRSMPKILGHAPKARLVIGGKGADLDRLEKLAYELGVSEHILFPGFIPVSEIPIYFAAADLFVFHSAYETFGIVLAEAMSYGKATVSVTSTAIPEVVEDGETGILVPTFDHEAFAEAVLRLLKDPVLRNELGTKGREKARRVFRWDAIAAKYEKVFESTIIRSSIPT